MSIPEAMEYLNDLKLHQQELEDETNRLRHQQDRLEEELRLLEDAVKRRMEKQNEAYSMMCAVKSQNYNKLFVENRQLKSEITGMKLDHRNEIKSLQKCDGCGATGVPLETSMFGNPEYCQSSGEFCKDCR